MQDKIISVLGHLDMQSKETLEPYQLYVQNPFPEKNNYQILMVVFNVSESCEVDFQKLDIEIGNSKNYLKYGYRKGSSRGGDITFTTKMSEAFATKLKTLKLNQLPFVVKASNNYSLVDENRLWISLQEFLGDTEKYNKLLTALMQTFEELSKEEKMSSIFSMRFEYVDGRIKYLSDFVTFQKILLANGTLDKSEKYGVKSEGKDQLCSVCLEKKPVIYGFASPFKYFTVDKPSFVSGFFKQENTWKNYPICSDCSLPFELGRDYISQNLQSYFYGRSFYVIPKPVFRLDDTKYRKLLIKLKDIYAEANAAKGRRIQHSEDVIMKLLGEVDNSFYLNLMFFEEDSKTKAIKVRLLIEEILPSRFRRLFVEIPLLVNQNPLYESALIIKKQPLDLKFSFGIFKTFFEENFLDVVQKVFEGNVISKEMVFANIMKVIRANYAKQQVGEYADPTIWTVKKAHMLIRYLHELKILSFKKYTYMDIFETTDVKDSKFRYHEFIEFVKNNTPFFDEDLKVGLFGLGMLVKYTMNIQYANIRSTPFEKKLKGYDLSLDDAVKIYCETLEKLKQYNASGYYQDLRERIIPKFLLNKHNPSRLSKNEISLYFVAGLELADLFRLKAGDQKED